MAWRPIWKAEFPRDDEVPRLINPWRQVLFPFSSRPSLPVCNCVESAWIPLRYQAQETSLMCSDFGLDHPRISGAIRQVSPREIKELSMGRRYSPDRPFNDFTITLVRDLISGLHRIGYSWKEIDYPDNLKGLWRRLAEIEHSLDAGDGGDD